MSNHGKQNQQRSDTQNYRGSGKSGDNPLKRLPSGKLVPGFLIIQKNGVVRMNKNYKGESLGAVPILGNMF